MIEVMGGLGVYDGRVSEDELGVSSNERLCACTKECVL